MEKKILTDEVLYTSTLLSDTKENSCTKTYLTEDNKILKIIPDKQLQHPALEVAINDALTYDHNNPILLGSSSFDDFILKNRELMEQKCLVSKDFSDLSSSICMPTTMIYKKDGTFIGYMQDKIEGKSLFDYRYNLQNNVELATSILLDLTNIVKNANEAGINITDLSNLSNIIITPELEVKLIDYDDFQINRLNSLVKSEVLSFKNNPILKTSKYYKDGLFTSNLDKISLLNTIYYSLENLELLGTDTSLAYQEHVLNDRVDNFVSINGYNYPDLFVELTDPYNKELKEITRDVFDLNKDNSYPTEALKTYAKRRMG